MGKKMDGLHVKVPPTFFRCPISLEVMRSPVSLCTGVTYDRDSIQRWLDSGNTTCPATNLPLPSTDLVPNLTLRRLINLWPHSGATGGAPTWQALVADLQRGGPSAILLRRILDFLRDPDRDEFEKHRLVSTPSFAASLATALKDGAGAAGAAEASLAVLDLVLAADFVDRESRSSAISAVASDLPRSAIAAVPRSETARIHAARVLEAILSSDSCYDGSKASAAEDRDLVAGLIRLIAEDASALACLVAFSEIRRSRPIMASLGVVPAAAGVLSSSSASPETAEMAMRLVESSSACAEGREAICAAAAEVLGAVVGRMNKAGTKGAEAASAVLWRVCHRHRDPRAVAAVAAVPGGLAKILLVMQSVCSPAARQMAGDLLKIFRVNSKSCLHRYDTNTTHIMPF